MNVTRARDHNHSHGLALSALLWLLVYEELRQLGLDEFPLAST